MNKASDMLEIQRWVPQVSILRPLLLLVYANDITTIQFSTKLIMYANETNAFGTLETMKYRYLVGLSSLLRGNKPQRNAKKTRNMVSRPINEQE